MSKLAEKDIKITKNIDRILSKIFEKDITVSISDEQIRENWDMHCRMYENIEKLLSKKENELEKLEEQIADMNDTKNYLTKHEAKESEKEIERLEKLSREINVKIKKLEKDIDIDLDNMEDLKKNISKWSKRDKIFSN